MLQYNSDRQDELDEAMQTVAWRDVHAEFLQPRLLEKLHRWATTPPVILGDGSTAFVFSHLWEQLLLDGTEMHIFVTLCVDRLRALYRFQSRGYMQQRMEELCCQYVWQAEVFDLLLQDVFELRLDP